MAKVLRRDKGPLVLLFATLAMMSWGCASGGKTAKAKEPTDMEPSQNEELANSDKQDAGDDLQGLGNNNDLAGQNLNLANEKDKEKEKPAEPAPAPQPTPAPVQAAAGSGYVGGKAGMPMEQGLPESGSKMAYIVQKGDTLSKIAKRVFRNLERWHELAEFSSLKNPNRIFPGDVIYYQLDKATVAFAKDYDKMERAETTVKAGETLSDVSKRIYGETLEWKLLWRHNDRIMDPNHLEVGSTVYYVNPSNFDSGAKLSKNNAVKKHNGFASNNVKLIRHLQKVKA